jgi:uncharacterized membrane protein (UPF0127 family)
VLLVAALLVVGGCGGEASPERGTAVIETAAGAIELNVEIADTASERAHGLMGREALPETSGMLFVYPEDSRSRFWMKQTLIPLSIAFLDADGRILVILGMEPCRADPCPTYDAGVAYRSALEVNQGALERLGAKVGDVVRLEG